MAQSSSKSFANYATITNIHLGSSPRNLCKKTVFLKLLTEFVLFLTVVCFVLLEFIGRGLGNGEEPEQIVGGAGVERRRRPM